MKSTKGKYEVFEVGEELVFSDDREKIKEYAREKGYNHITYQTSSDDKDNLKRIAREI